MKNHSCLHNESFMSLQNLILWRLLFVFTALVCLQGFFVVFLISSRKMLEYYLKLEDEHILSHHFQLVIRLLSFLSTLCSLS
jgi:hypothetical protein